jgi:eukaryotic-like serine/threonine-protein kinase
MIGHTFGHYRVLEKLGAGGMGVVYHAHDDQLDRPVALKVLPADTLGDEVARARLVQEARLASKLNHPHICTIYEVGSVDGQTYLAMELVEGRPLSERLTEGPLPVDEALRCGRQLADALAHAHERQVVHRDFKSANVVLTPQGRVKVLDFGLAKRLTDDQLVDVTTVTRQTLTAVGTVAGTLAYMAPEQLRGQPADARSDIWALGVVLYEMTGGRRPFEGKTGFEVTSAILTVAPPPLPASVPAPLAAVVDRCLAKDPDARYQRAAEVDAALEAVQAGSAVVPAASPPRLRPQRRRLIAMAVGLAALFALAAALVTFDVGGVRSRVLGGPLAPARAIRLAVLPFANLSGQADQEYLTDGLTQEMIAQLGRLHPGTLSVIARTSVMRYKKTEKPVDQIGRELGVDYVLEGSAQREAGRIRVTAELIKVIDQTQLWADGYEREMAGILALQSDVAQKVAAALALKLLPAEQARLVNTRAVNPEAYEAYLKGSQYWIKMTPGDVDTAERYFEAALQKDPNYAAPYTGLAWVWACRNQMGFSPPAIAVPRMKAAVTKAIALDEGLAEAHFALAGLLTWSEWNFAAAGREWKRALELNPNWAEGAAMYSHYLMTVNRPDEAMLEIERAVKLDPFNVTVHAFYTIALMLDRRNDDAIAQGQATLKMQADNSVAINGLVFALCAAKRCDEAAVVSESLYRNWHPDLADALKEGLADGGYKGAYRRVADIEVAKYADEPGIANDAASNYLLAGDYDRALAWFEKAYEARDPNLPYLACAPWADPLRPDPRYQALVRKMGLSK